ncbi:hypothetical protein ANRL4_04913 [Anaerolineae bacterium]|nr:hypothetical protein ANRL4_04913 [Anaerolineae bacterium]
MKKELGGSWRSQQQTDMSEYISKLELIWRTRAGGGGKTQREYLDFVIDGQSLGDLLNSGDYIGCLGWLPVDVEQQSIDELLLKRRSELTSGRYRLYICPECGDLDCGAITVQIEKTADQFMWKDFGFENNRDEPILDRQQYRHVGPFQFNKIEYWQVLSNKPSAQETRR